MKGFLKGWLIFVALLRVLSVVLGYFDVSKIQNHVFDQAQGQVTDVTGRTFAIWTLLSCVVTFMAAFNLESKPLYNVVLASFIIAFTYFFLEVFVYGTVSLRSAASPAIVSSLSIVLLIVGSSSIHKSKSP